MQYKYFSHNGEIQAIDQAVVPLSRIEYSYGYGVYETIRVAKGRALFVDEHCHRLMRSAEIINLEHTFTIDFVQNAIGGLIKENAAEACNLKLLLIGGPDKDSASLDILCFNPLFPDRKLYKTGASCITYNYEREFPGAKTLNMLSSYLAYREAVKVGAYDALLINRQGCVTEGTRTNFFAIRDRTLISPPNEVILPGVTRAIVIKIADKHNFKVVEENIKLSSIGSYDGAFLTGTPIKILPIGSIGNKVSFASSSPITKELIFAFDQYLKMNVLDS